MGTWFVIGVKPTMFETTCSNAVERYTRLTDKKHDIDIDFQFNKNEDPSKSPLKSMPQRGWVQGNRDDSGLWKVSPFGPIRMPYPIIELDADGYDWVVVGHEGRDYAWIMSRKPVMDDALYNELKTKLAEKHGYDSLEGLRKVPQVWTREEREKRGLVNDIADEFLKN
jgi:apolipoprotein D and lipocalin family protein